MLIFLACIVFKGMVYLFFFSFLRGLLYVLMVGGVWGFFWGGILFFGKIQACEFFYGKYLFCC